MGVPETQGHLVAEDLREVVERIASVMSLAERRSTRRLPANEPANYEAATRRFPGRCRGLLSRGSGPTR